MAGFSFDAASAVEALRFDFTTYRPQVPDDPEHPDFERLKTLADEEWSGVIPEPTDDAVERLFQDVLPRIRRDTAVGFDTYTEWFREQRRAWAVAHAGEAGVPEGVLTDEQLEQLPVQMEQLDVERERFTAMTREARAEQRAATIAAFAEFTQGHPSAAVLGALPWRAFQMFVGWLSGQFSPEAVAAAMTS